jgi:Tfp pilus assembly protein PilF
VSCEGPSPDVIPLTAEMFILRIFAFEEGKMRVDSCLRRGIRLLVLLCTAGIVLAGTLESIQRGDPGFKSGRGNGRLTVRISDPEGNPLAGVEVRLVFSQIDSLVHKGTTNKRGDLAFNGLGTGMWNLTVFGPGFELTTASISVSQSLANPPVRVKLRKSGTASDGRGGDAESQASFMEGCRLMEEGKFASALLRLESFVAANPSEYGARLIVAECRREMGLFEKAEADYGIILDKAGKEAAFPAELTARALFGLGSVRMKQGRTAEAAELLGQAAEKWPRDGVLAYKVGEALFSGKEYDQAARHLRAASQLKPDWPEPFLKLGYLHMARSENAEAAAQFEKFLALEPQGERAASVKTILGTIRK